MRIGAILICLLVSHAGTHDFTGTWVPKEYLPAPFQSDVVPNSPA